MSTLLDLPPLVLLGVDENQDAPKSRHTDSVNPGSVHPASQAFAPPAGHVVQSPACDAPFNSTGESQYGNRHFGSNGVTVTPGYGNAKNSTGESQRKVNGHTDQGTHVQEGPSGGHNVDAGAVSAIKPTHRTTELHPNTPLGLVPEIHH